MSQIKSLSDQSNSIDYTIDMHVHSDLQVYCNQIIKDIHDQLFFDQHLTNERCMYILNHRHTIESEFIRFLNDCIHHLNIDWQIRAHLLANLNKFSMNLTQINSYNDINHAYHINSNSDEESDVDDSTVHLYSDDEDDDDDCDICDDLENLILDELEMEQYD